MILNRAKSFAAILVGLVTYLAVRTNLAALLIDRPRIKSKGKWRRISGSPGSEEEYPPQGIVFVDGDLFITNHWNGECSCLYRVDPETGDVLESAMMPDEAKHTSGLTWDGDYLWAVDHACNKLYKLDAEATFEESRAVVEKEFPTGLLGSSGLTLIKKGGTRYLAVSDFLWTMETRIPLPIGSAKTYIAELELIEEGMPIRDAATVTYSNGGYSQGLTWDGSYLYESVNMIGTNKIEVFDISQNPNANGLDIIDVEQIGSFEAPGYFVEDLGTDCESLWTTDEFSYELSELNQLDEVQNQI